MQAPQYTDRSPGRLVPVGEGRVAFVPDPLPTELVLDRDGTDALASAEYALGRLAGATGTIDDRSLVLAPLQHREAILSSRIDRILTTPEQLVLLEAGAPDGTDEERGHARAVLRYVKTIEHGLASPLPVSVRLISELHAVLVTEDAGRREQSEHSEEGLDPTPASDDQPRVVRLPVRDMQNCLDAFQARLQVTSDRLPPLVELALLHYQFEAIHPFRQGNGRLGRLILPLILSRQGRLPQPLLYLSAYLERHRDEYFESLRAVSQRSAWLQWIQFFVRGVEDSATECLAHAESLLELHEHYHALFRDSAGYARLQPVIDGLFRVPCLIPSRVASTWQMTEQQGSEAIDELVGKGILFGVDGAGHERVFLAPAILGFMRNRDEAPSA